MLNLNKIIQKINRNKKKLKILKLTKKNKLNLKIKELWKFKNNKKDHKEKSI
jgi:hypothetical protein